MINVTFKVILAVTFVFAISSSTVGMDFSWVSIPATTSTSEGRFIKMSGEIKPGDYEKFRSFMKTHFEKYKSNRFIQLSSNGGNLVEALKIAELLRKVYPSISVEDGTCASSCFFLYLSGASRFAKHPSSLGVHRAYFDPKYFSGLKPEAARKRQNELITLVNSILDDNGVPQLLKDKMNQTSSNKIYWLTERDVLELGSQPVWYEEFMIAKCNFDESAKIARMIRKKNLQGEDTSGLFDDMALSYINSRKCEDKIISEELSSLSSLLSYNEH